jgi:hypothetical protein
MALLRQSFEKKAFEFREVLKIGRTQLQDAVPPRSAPASTPIRTTRRWPAAIWRSSPACR